MDVQRQLSSDLEMRRSFEAEDDAEIEALIADSRGGGAGPELVNPLPAGDAILEEPDALDVFAAWKDTKNAVNLAEFLKARNLRPRQVQDFIPAPMDIGFNRSIGTIAACRMQSSTYPRELKGSCTCSVPPCMLRWLV